MLAVPKVVCILGMHRSGTSCLTGSLQEAGVDLGNCHSWNPHNRKGNRENQEIVDLNDAVLHSNDAAWDNPRPAIRWSTEHLQEARRLVTRSTSACFGFKDPRTLLTLKGWAAAVPELSYIGIFRHPMNVAQSLKNRSGMPIEDGLDLWYQYNRRLCLHYSRHRFPILCFDDEESLFKQKLKKVFAKQGLYDDSKDSQFYDSNLRTAEGDAAHRLGWQISGLYKILKTIAE